MKVNIYNKIKSNKGLLIVPVFKKDLKTQPKDWPVEVKNFVRDRAKLDKFEAKKDEVFLTYLNNKNLPQKLIIVGAGELAKYNERLALECGGKLGKIAKKEKLTELTVLLPSEIIEYASEFVEGLVTVQYKYDRFKTSAKNLHPNYRATSIDIITAKSSKSLETNLSKTMIVCHAVDFVRDLVNSPSNVVDGDYLANQARRIAKENKYKVTVFGNKELKKMAWGALLAVNQGAEKEAKCIVLQYDGSKNKKEKPLVIIGKGVIFDTGGYNLKPTGGIETMHQDMSGGATVLGIFEVLKKLGIQKNVIGVIPVAENLINERAYRPSDIIKTFSGKTVEITNTDAEGRLILADAITYGTRQRPEAIITIATLTGAVAVALGDRYAGIMGNDINLRRAIFQAGKEVDDLVWPLPIHRDYKKKMNSDVADYKNYDLGSGRYAGSEKGAAFLEKFVEKNKWCHIDIGGTAYTDDPKEYQTKGSTAHGLRLLLRFLQN